jgi:hypothetical protein
MGARGARNVRLRTTIGAVRLACRSVGWIGLCAVACAAAPANQEWTPPKTAWGEPDLEGVWTSDDSIGVPFERPKRYGNRKWQTDEEYAERDKENQLISTSVKAGVIPDAGYWVQHQGVDAKPYASNWTEYARHTSRQTSLIVEPENGHFPPLTGVPGATLALVTPRRSSSFGLPASISQVVTLPSCPLTSTWIQACGLMNSSLLTTPSR